MANLSIPCLLLLLFAAVLAQETTLTYIIEHELDQSDQYVQLTLTVQTEGRSMRKAIDDAARVIAAIESISKRYCLQGSRSSGECGQSVQASKYEVESKYHLVRKVQTFTLFILTHEVTVKIHNMRALGKMVDQIVEQGEGMVTLGDFAWKAVEEVDAEITTLREGLQEGKELCAKLGKTLVQVLSVEQLQQEEEEQDGQEQEADPDLTPPEIQTTILKFKVKCGPQKSKSKGKK